MPGLTVLALTLAAAAPLRAQQATGGSEQHSEAVAPADTAHKAKTHSDKHGHQWLSFDAASNTVTFKLVAGRAHGPTRLNFNGYAQGRATLVVPANSKVVIHFLNKDSLPHSAAIIADGPIPTTVEPALPKAATKDLTQGLPRHGTDEIRFTAPKSGSYRIASGMPGQARSGMWIRLRVDPRAKTPALLKHT
jgi:sulfocyanin SoxE-like protein